MSSNVKLVLIIIAILLAVVLLSVWSVQSVQNQAISIEEQIDTAKSDISVQQKRRADLIPNLVDCVKAYDEHEYNTLVGIIEARGTDDDAIGNVTTMIKAVAEAYPDLKSSENYRALMDELSVTENLIANYRSNYNTWVKRYNQYVRKFPNQAFLNMLGYDVLNFEYLKFESAMEDAPTNLFGDQ